MDRKSIEAVYKLAPLQQGILFHCIYDPTTPLYLEQASWPVYLNLELDLFAKAWQVVFERHDILRTAFLYKDLENPVQVVMRKVSVPMELLDFRDLDSQQREQAVADFLNSRRLQPFDFSKAPLSRLALIQLSEDEFILVWNFHHILMDGWGSAIVIREVLTIYDAYLRGTEPHLPAAPHYSSHIAYLEKKDPARAKAYWQETLAGFTAPTQLGIDQGFLGSLEQDPEQGEFQWNGEILETIAAFARNHRLTLNSVIQGAWALLLSSYSGDWDVIHGAVVSGRPADLPGVEDTVGLFINTVPVRTLIDPSLSLQQLLAQVQSRFFKTQQFDFSPLTLIRDWSGYTGSLPLFESLVVVENYPFNLVPRPPAVDGRVRGLQSQTYKTRTHYALTLMVYPGDNPYLRLNFNTRRFAAGDTAALMGHYLAILHEIMRDPAQTVAQLNLLTETEKRALLIQDHETYPQQTLQALFQDQVERNPERIALRQVGEDGSQVGSISYRELDRKAEAIAIALQEQGIAHGDRVGVCAPRAIETVAGLLAALRVGAVFVPMDQGQPMTRLAFMCRDAGVSVLLSTTEFLPRFGDFEGTLMSLDQPAPSTERGLQRIPHDLADPLCITYTSGSTGRPKGVVCHQRGMLNRYHWMWREFPFQAGETCCHKTSLGFLDSSWEIFGPLLAGVPAVVIPDEPARDPATLVAILERHAVSRIVLVPSLLQTILELCRERERPLPDLQLWSCSGEAFPTALGRRFRERFPDAALLNIYGSSEVSADATYYPFESHHEGKYLPIGAALPNLSVYVLDRRGRLTPTGVPGQLFVGGVGLAYGYIGRPAKTAECFLPDPYSAEPGARLYASGDLARFRADPAGAPLLEYLGRTDHQFKIRGFRVEAGEVEACLVAHPEVSQSVVTLAAAANMTEKSLAAYVVPVAGAQLDIAALRDFVADRLPQFMVPTYYLVLEKLPLTANGKLNRLALPAPGTEVVVKEYLAPETDAERVITQAWAEVLGRERVSLLDDFFALGGNSLVAVRLIVKLNQAFDITLTLADLFDESTPGGLALLVEERLLEEMTEASDPD